MRTIGSTQKLSKFWFAVSNMLPPVGFFLYFKFRTAHPLKARQALISALAGIPIGIAAGYLLNRFVFAAINA